MNNNSYYPHSNMKFCISSENERRFKIEKNY